MDKKLIIGLAIAATAMLALPALAASDYTAALKRVEGDVVQPGYKNLGAKTKILHQTVDQFCNTGLETTDVPLEFQNTMDAWQVIQHVRHGRIAENDRHARMQFWPDKRAKTGKHLRKFLVSGSLDDLTPEMFSTKSVAIQGLQTLERLMFTNDGLSPTPRNGQALSSCAVAVAISANLRRISDDVLSARSDTVTQTDAKASIRAHITDMITGLEVISRLKLSGPMGKERVRPKLAENWRSARSMKNIQINLQALRAQYTALVSPSLDDDPESKLIINQFDNVIEKSKSMGDALVPVLGSVEGRTQLRALVLSIQDLRELVIIKLTDHFKINLGFNSLDGD